MRTITLAEALDLLRRQTEEREAARQRVREGNAREEAASACARCPHGHDDCEEHR